jgi:hypothetical protein
MAPTYNPSYWGDWETGRIAVQGQLRQKLMTLPEK